MTAALASVVDITERLIERGSIGHMHEELTPCPHWCDREHLRHGDTTHERIVIEHGASDPSVYCALSQVGDKATIIFSRRADEAARFINVDAAETEGRALVAEGRAVLAAARTAQRSRRATTPKSRRKG
jgi:hypothetical protein